MEVSPEVSVVFEPRSLCQLPDPTEARALMLHITGAPRLHQHNPLGRYCRDGVRLGAEGYDEQKEAPRSMLCETKVRQESSMASGS